MKILPAIPLKCANIWLRMTFVGKGSSRGAKIWEIKDQIGGNECIGVRRGGCVRGLTGNNRGFLHSQTACLGDDPRAGYPTFNLISRLHSCEQRSKNALTLRLSLSHTPSPFFTPNNSYSPFLITFHVDF